MENKKQLIIVPPMSGPLQKLNEVLVDIAENENVEISIVDDRRELNQFVGSSGQCLLLFSNAKKCATFLQENRFIIAKFHTKVILLTPNEIPAKTLMKFVKVGLTESILESSPPKTLLYKVKLLLRSIKSQIAQQEDQDQVVKSMLDFDSSIVKSDIAASKMPKEENTSGPLDKEATKLKKDQSENADEYGEYLVGKKIDDSESIDSDDHLKSKSSIREESIETHWKTRRKKHDFSTEDGSQKVDDEESSEIDLYYRGKNSRKNSDIVFEENLYGKRKQHSDVAEEELSEKKRKPETVIDIEIAKSKPKDALEEVKTDLDLSPKKDGLIIEVSDEQKATSSLHGSDEKDEAENRKKEFEELEALFAEAKKRQAQDQTQDLGGHLKGKILNNGGEEENSQEREQEKTYDNSDLYGRNQKSLHLNLIEAEKKKKSLHANEQEQVAPRESQVDRMGSDQMSGKNSTDNVNTLMMSEFGEDRSKKLKTFETFELASKKQKEKDREEDSPENDNKSELTENLDEDAEMQSVQDALSDTEKEKAKKRKLELELAGQLVNKTEKEVSDEDNGPRRNLRPLDPAEDDKDYAAKSETEDANQQLMSRKLAQKSLDSEGKRDALEHLGKVDKIDTYYRGGKGIKTEHSWENLNKHGADTGLKRQKAGRHENEFSMDQNAVDNGELTIDYRKLKKEFDQISHGTRPTDQDGDGSRSLLDSEDEGTFKVIEVDARGFDFGINIVNLIYQKDSRPLDFYKMIAGELITKYNAYSVFYSYKSSEGKHSESFDSFLHFSTDLVSEELKERWIDIKSQDQLMTSYFSKNTTTWLCREIQDKSNKNGGYWEDVELPQWAANELTTKKVELIFPYYDGTDRMGLAIVFFPEGVNPKTEKGLNLALEMLRTILLDDIQRMSSLPDNDESVGASEKKNVLNMFTGLFSRSKTG